MRSIPLRLSSRISPFAPRTLRPGSKIEIAGLSVSEHSQPSPLAFLVAGEPVSLIPGNAKPQASNALWNAFPAGTRENTLAFLALSQSWAIDPRDVALSAKQATQAFNADAMLVQMASNRPDNPSISDLSIDQAKLFQPEGAEPVEVLTPLGQCPGIEAWQAPLASLPATHVPDDCHKAAEYHVQPVPASDPTAGLVAEWLASPDRRVTVPKRNRFQAAIARFWETGDKRDGTQPIDPRNAFLRAMAGQHKVA